MRKDILKQAKNIAVLITVSWSIKLLLIPAYYSTDFIVHQNWLRITHEKPISQWYFNAQSKWTLDYPPFFAYFQYLLSIVANLFNKQIVQTINQLPQTVIFQRLSVIVTDLFYLWTLLKFSNGINFRLVLLYLWIPFIILDNIHFQYNLMMQAIFVLSVGYMNQQKYLKSAFYFSVLLNFKHIYLYCAPAFFIYLLKEYVFARSNRQQQQIQRPVDGVNQEYVQQNGKSQIFISKLIKLGAITLLPFIISFGPFFIVGGLQGIKQIFNRLFPFSRGLVHQYWAPNFWTFYYLLDKILFAIGLRGKQIYTISSNQTMVNKLKVLPQVEPSHTILIILGVLAPIIITYFFSKRKSNFAMLVSICGFIFFMFGFHVHEKAVVPYISLLFLFSPQLEYLNAATFVNIVNLIPLLIQPKQKMLCIFFCLLWTVIWDFLDQHKRQHLIKQQQVIIRKFQFRKFKQLLPLYTQYAIQISGFLIIFYHLLVHPLLKINKLEFLPYMINSVWAAFFNFIWIGYLYLNYIYQQLFVKVTPAV